MNVQKIRNKLSTRELEKNDLNILKNFHKKIIRKLPLHNSSTLKNLNKMYI